jgi:adenine-specific DNA methylase
LIDLLGQSSDSQLQSTAPRPKPSVRITCASADDLPIEDASIDCVVMDPPYYDNVMYAELSDFFYVWLKRTAGLLYPELFTGHLTDKDREAVANAAKFAGQKGGAKNLAGRDYQRRMASIFREQRRVLKPDGIMTVMFTHKAAGAWDALAGGLIEAGFTITASWPVNTEAEGSLHIREKSAARSTIFLVCRVREADSANAEPR